MSEPTVPPARLRSGRRRFAQFAQNGVFAALLVAAALLLAVLAEKHSTEFDLTQNARNTLSAGSRQTLALLKGPIEVTAYATEQDPQLGDLRRRIADFYAPWQREKRDLKLVFVDPRASPQALTAAGIRVNGEMIVSAGGRSEHLTTLDEAAFANLLARLARAADRQVFFLDGHGERRADGGANHDVGEFARRLATKGMKIAPLNLATVQAVPDNTAVLVVAGPQVDLLPLEVDKLLAYVKRGGNLLWMIDDGSLHGLQPLADALALSLTPGVVVDPSATELKATATLALASRYAPHAATRGFNLTTAFPFARRIAVADDPRGWKWTPLVEAAPRGWVETGPLGDTVRFDRERDTAGPVVVAGTLERDVDGRAQRVVVTGSGHFVANTYVGLLGNLDLGVNFVNWASGDETLITLEPRSTHDASLELSRAWLIFISLFFAIALPGALLFTGAFTWWQRRRG